MARENCGAETARAPVIPSRRAAAREGKRIAAAPAGPRNDGGGGRGSARRRRKNFAPNKGKLVTSAQRTRRTFGIKTKNGAEIKLPPHYVTYILANFSLLVKARNGEISLALSKFALYYDLVTFQFRALRNDAKERY